MARLAEIGVYYMGGTVAETITLVMGVTSIVLALAAICYARDSARESRKNFQATRDLLSETDKRAAVTESAISQSHQQLLDTVTSLATPREESKEDKALRFAVELIPIDPEGARLIFESI